MSRRSFILLVVSAVVLAVGVVTTKIVLNLRQMTASGSGSIPGQIRVSPDTPIGGPFALTDQNGRRVTDVDFRGRFMLVYFGYTFCPDVCPTELNTMALALKELGADAVRVVPVFITVDPARDTPDTLKAYLASFGPEFIGLTGSDEEIAAAAKAYRVYYKKAEGTDPANYSMDHTSLLYLMGSDGKIAALFRTEITADDLAAGIRAAVTMSRTAG